MIKIIHGADFHLDSPFSGLTPERAAQRRGEQRELLDRLAALAREKQADLVLLAGDLLDSERVFRETAQALSTALASIPCPVFIAPGNHDFYGPRSVWTALDWPENVHIFDELEQVELPGCTLWGRAFSDPHQAACPLRGIAVPDDGRLHLAVLHGNVGGAEGDYGPITPGDIAASGLDYLALGHIHKRAEPARYGNTLCAWPGCPEGQGFDELGEKVFYEGTLSEDGTVSLAFVPFAGRRYEILEVDVTGRDPRAALEATLPPDTAGDLYRILLAGETGEGGVDTASLEAALADRFYALEIRDMTRMAEDVWARAGEDSLRGLFLQELQKRLEGDSQAREIVSQAARFGLAALDHRDLG